MLTYAQVASRRREWLARRGLRGLGQDGGDSYDITDPSSAFYDASAIGSSQYPTGADFGNTAQDYTDAGLPVPSWLTTEPSASGSFSNFGGFFSSLASLFHPSQSYAATVTTPQGQYGASVTTPAATPASGFSLASLTDFSTPWPYLAIGGIVLLMASRSGKAG